MRSLRFPLLLAVAASALTPAQWRSQSIYQVLTDRFALTNGSTTQPCDWGNYCGGTWQGIVNKLDYIKGMGFTAVWISPVVENIPNSKYGRPYHGYWAQNLYSLNTNFGTEADLKALSAALHARGMYLMVDVVANHMASSEPPSAVKYSQLYPFNDAKYYHPYCPLDYGNKTSVEQCWMGDTVVPLPDLKTEDASVQQSFQSWITQLVSNYSIDGLRLDSAMQTDQQFWPGFVSASGVYAMGEVLDGSPNTFCTWQNYMPGALNYPTYYWLIRAFSSNTATMSELANNIQWLNATCQDTTLLANFIENHDQARFPSITKDAGLTQNVIAFTVLHDGIPVVYQGQEQGFSGAVDPYNREPLWTSLYSTKSTLYTFISALNTARRLAISKDSAYASSKSTVWYSDSQTIVTRKGASDACLIALFTNRGAGNSGNIALPAAKTGIQPSTKFTDLLSCEVFAADAAGDLVISITNGLPRALYMTSALSGSDVCASTASMSTRPVTGTHSSSTLTTLTSSACPIASTVAVTFQQNVTTKWLESISVVGSIPELGNWNPRSAFNLSAAGYTFTSPIWNGTMDLPAGTSFEYKFIKYHSNSNALTWEADPNRKYTVPRSCATTAMVSGSWQT
ncbi:carbohydrate-binding module family 20 protein [Cercospora zeae-maydis SCOH1-5]|uniref:alpha-amylase n=1 Tax=Cercospora zeae-maydis SCOH1-5 TaxID=717836 RepID=A0A6A6FRJ6_9PEZI|nr:carbohydrate-binding module family 20 protein [Cercospora zeae-maydis SCOH1-5]